MEKYINAEIHNRFDIVVRDSVTGEIKQTAEAYNIILNKFWDSFLSSGNYKCTNYIAFGSGTAVPLPTDTALTTPLGVKSSATDSIDISTFYTDGVIKRKRSIRLESAEYVGSAIGEVGFANNNGASYIVTKAIIKDANGNPLIITKGASDVVDIFATLFAKVPMSLINGTDGMGIVSPNGGGIIDVLLCKGISFTGGYCIGNAPPFGLSGSSVTANPTISYDVANKKLGLTIPDLIASAGNVGGLSSYLLKNLGIKLPRTGFTQPVITKEVIATGDGTAKDFVCSFSRMLNNGTAKLYVNDIEVSATFDFGYPINTTSLHEFLVCTKYDVVNGPVLLENPFYQNLGLDVIKIFGELWVSEDNTNWTSLGASASNNISIPSTHQHKRYWKITKHPSYPESDISVTSSSSTDCSTYKHIHAASAPANGDVVALTYQPNCIAKDANHVIKNVSITMTFNEYI